MCYKELEDYDKDSIHEILFQMGIVSLEDYDKIESFYEKLPEHIKKEGIHWGFSDSVVRDMMCVWFHENIL